MNKSNHKQRVFFTADHHFGHANIIRFCDRPFKDVSEMDRRMVEEWNSVVGKDDIVYHLGDFTLGKYLNPWVSRLTFGELRIVPGGHDHRWLQTFSPLDYLYVSVLPPLVTVKVQPASMETRVVVLCHYPMLSWDRSHYGSIHLHGHSHGRISDGISLDPGLSEERSGRRIDVGVDNWNFRPVTLEEAIQK